MKGFISENDQFSFQINHFNGVSILVYGFVTDNQLKGRLSLILF